ncbi:uncharacterized protein BJ171DRAFT_450687 [Polychytrium aggregatum]|uniref:uncharacterized protein n=1 Tax=Polychytrium aggregatum TaxID=110093 RepID=UPI0022FF4557|nr:uncharacterized protein BJ171DRAFT_450687 [Polychytrium aggregatum]KAI9190828.1 hypothetical protein BJ171DRAFT_450687 [Polychytrium aggregatum]
MTVTTSFLAGAPAAILAYCGSSILMTVTNKVVLSSYRFNMNFLVLAIQSIVCVIILELFVALKWSSHRAFKVEEAKKWFVVSLALVAMIYTGSKALQYMSIPLFTIFKNLTIILIAYGELMWFNGSRITKLMFLSFIMMVMSSVIAGASDIASGKAQAKVEASNFVAYGWMVSNCLTTAFYALMMRGKIKEVGFKDNDTVFYNNLLSIPILVVMSFLTEGNEYRKTVDRYWGDDLDASRQSEFQGLAIALAISGISGFAISYGSSWCVRVTSSTTYSMVGALNKLPIAIAGMIFFDDAVTVPGVLGVLIAFTAGIIYSHAKNLQKAQQGLPLPVTESPKDICDTDKS